MVAKLNLQAAVAHEILHADRRNDPGARAERRSSPGRLVGRLRLLHLRRQEARPFDPPPAETTKEEKTGRWGSGGGEAVVEGKENSGQPPESRLRQGKRNRIGGKRGEGGAHKERV